MLSVPGIAKLPELAWMLFSVFRTQLLQESRGATEVMAQARLELKQFFESMPQRSMPMNDPILLSRSLKAILKYPRNDAEKQAWITLLLFELCQDSTLMLSDLGGSVLESLDHSRLFLLSYFRYGHRLVSSLFRRLSYASISSAEIHPHILKRKGFVSCLASGTLGENGLCTHCDKQQETDGMKRVSIESWAFLFQMTLSVDDRIYLLSGLPRMLRHAPSHEVNLATPLFKKLLCNEGLLHENHNVRSAVL